MSDSFYVPGPTVKRWRAIAKLFVPIVMVAAGTAWTTTVTWFKTRPSTEEVTKLTASCTTVAKDAQAKYDTQHVQIYALQQSALDLATAMVELHAQSEVTRAYWNSKRLPEYIDRARKFYALEFARQQTEHPNNVPLAFKLTIGRVWRPDRD